MATLLKSLLGNGSKDAELTAEMRAAVQDMRQERSHCETLVKSARASLTRIQELGAPIAKATSDMDAVTERLAGLEKRLSGLDRLATHLQSLDDRAERIGQSQRQAETRITHATEDTQRIRAQLEELGHKVDMALDLKERLAGFLEMEQPLEQLRLDADALHQQMDGSNEQLTRMRDQHERLMDAHKVAFSKLETFERRHEDLGRSVQDKERRLASVEQSLRGMDDVQQTVEDAKRRLGTLKALGEYVAQKTAALEAQREVVERAVARADELDQAMRQLDAGVRQQRENAATLDTLKEQVADLQSLHETVLQRSGEVDRVRREGDEQIRLVRAEVAAARDEVRVARERFDFESSGLEAVSQRVADLRSALTELEGRFGSVSESSQAVGELQSQSQAVAAQLQSLSGEVGRLDEETRKVQGLRRDLDEVDRIAQAASERVARIDEARPATEAALRDIEQLAGTHARVKDALEQTRLVSSEIARVRGEQTDTRSWLTDVQGSLSELEERVDELRKAAPTVEFVQKQVQRVNESMSTIESRRDFVEELHRRMADLGALAGTLDERGHDLQTRMEAAEQRFVGLAAHAEEAERLGKAISAVSSDVGDAERHAGEIGKRLTVLDSRCQSVEDIAERTRMLRQELEQRQRALEEATAGFERASELRQEAAASAQELEERAKGLEGALASADRQVGRVHALATELEDRANSLRFVDKRLKEFEERLAKWDLVEQEITRSLDQLSSRQGTVEAVKADVDRMFVLAERTAADVRAITTAHHEIAESREQLDGVVGELREMRDVASTLDDRKRQLTQAEDRLERAEALVIDLRSSLETLQGQQALVDQAVEKAGALRFLLKQAEAMVEGLREEREMITRVRQAMASVPGDDAAHAARVERAG
jgi:DNA repair exonuclease SbcCD ATPase subunit